MGSIAHGRFIPLLGVQEQPVTLFDRPVGVTVRFLRYERAL